MRHQKSFNKLGRKKGHRKAMLSNMACSLIEHKRINTTVAKAKALKMFVEPLITKSKQDTTHSRRIVFKYLQNKFVVTELFREVAPKIADRPGGYTRIIKTGFRLGDAAEMCMIELVDFNEIYTKEEKKKTRRRRSTKKKTDAPAAVKEETTKTDEETKTEEVKSEKAPEVKEEKKADESSDKTDKKEE